MTFRHGQTVTRVTRMSARVMVCLCLLIGLAACVPLAPRDSADGPTPTPTRTRTPSPTPSPTVRPPPPPPAPPASSYPWHTNITATTFWVGEIFDPDAEDGSQMISTYDSDWWGSYGGCDGVQASGGCETEPRAPGNGYFPSSMTPLQNPFYLDVPYDDINDSEGFAMRDQVVPWASQPEYAAHAGDQSFSYLKNRWLQLELNGAVCYGQIEDAGPGEYHDAAYVFGSGDERPLNTRYGGAGLDVSPALTGCLGFSDINGITGGISWRFVEASEVPPGPWLAVVTTSGVR